MMKFPSFIKVPKHKRFNVEPRYYDPVKEEIEQRTERIRLEVEQERAQTPGRRIRFEQPIERHRKEDFRASFLQAGIFFFFIATVVGYYYYGPQVFWGFLAFIPVYLFIRFKRLL